MIAGGAFMRFFFNPKLYGAVFVALSLVRRCSCCCLVDAGRTACLPRTQGVVAIPDSAQRKHKGAGRARLSLAIVFDNLSVAILGQCAPFSPL